MDLLNKLGAKPASEGATSTQKSEQVEPAKKTEESISAAIETKTTNEAVTSGAANADPAVKDPDDWSKDSALKEVIKLREENKAQRVKYQEKLDEFKIDLAAQNEPLKQELEHLKKYKDELTKIKAAEEDKKRTLEDKVVHRETRIAELEAKIAAEMATKDREVQTFKEQLSVFQAQEAARKQLYQEKLTKELQAIPGKFREQAELIAKGAGDPSEALVALSEARIKGLFEDRTVVVNHSVPGAKDGARATKEQLEANANAGRDSMSSSDKIKTALKDIRQGTGNPAFRTH